MFKTFPQFWQTPTDYEPIWIKCTGAISHACKALQVKGKDSSLSVYRQVISQKCIHNYIIYIYVDIQE